jgi:hypothetical protein
LWDELQDDGDEHIIFAILVEQLSENLNEAHKSCGGNKPRHRPNVERGTKVSHVRIFCDYFAMRLVYNEKKFRYRFWMHRKPFLKMEIIVLHDFYFVQKRDVTRLLGLSSI